jgi:hypothetical protein
MIRIASKEIMLLFLAEIIVSLQNFVVIKIIKPNNKGICDVSLKISEMSSVE